MDVSILKLLEIREHKKIKFYLGLSLTEINKHSIFEDIIEPSNIEYRRIRLKYNMFNSKKEFMFFGREILSNNEIIFFPETMHSWGLIKNAFIIDNFNRVWGYGKLNLRIPSQATIFFGIGNLKIYINKFNINQLICE